MFEEFILPNQWLPLFKPEFDRLMKQAKQHSMVSRKRMQNLWRLLQRVERDRVAGDLVELGVARGGTAILIDAVARQSRLERESWFYDAFELLPKPDAVFQDTHDVLFGQCGCDPQRVHLIKGWVADTVPQRPPRPIAFMHIDMGGYDPVRQCLDPLFPLVSTGGWVAFDNYGDDDGCHRAVDAFLSERAMTGSLRRFGRTQVYFQKA